MDVNDDWKYDCKTADCQNIYNLFTVNGKYYTLMIRSVRLLMNGYTSWLSWQLLK